MFHFQLQKADHSSPDLSARMELLNLPHNIFESNHYNLSAKSQQIEEIFLKTMKNFYSRLSSITIFSEIGVPGSGL